MNEERLIELTKQLEKVNDDYQHFINYEISQVENNDYLWNILGKLTKIEIVINEICKIVVTRP